MPTSGTTVGTPAQKPHASGSWRVVHSKSVPASVTAAHSKDTTSAYQSGIRPIVHTDEKPASKTRKAHKTPGYFETTDSAFSNS